MTLLLLCALIALGLVAGGFGALAGVGGGFLIVPTLILFFHLPVHEAIGISLVAVIATSTATSAVQVERGVTDVRLGFVLELTTTTGAIIASLLAAYLSKRMLAGLFVAFLAFTLISMLKKAWTSRAEKEPSQEVPEYRIKNYPAGMGAALLAGGLSGLLGIGGGLIKVPVMMLFMGIPTRVATATSNFMIGVTAATSAWIWYSRGFVNLGIAGPLVAGVMVGSHFGAQNARRVKSRYIVLLLIVAAGYLMVQMLVKLKSGQI
ncbi:MAG: sulfite exporter TauE/SafE family protein [Acidobacteriaceae bacterium]